ncbi:MAG: hypothetical protein IPK50_07725 [Fibrobacterota bacterium]|nr:MAG: hypothetical protein IPK50_07725 [Fibrobacterota bacterium]
MGFRPMAAQYDKGGGGLGFAGPIPANPLEAVENADCLDKQRKFLLNSIYTIPSLENWDEVMPAFPSRTYGEPDPEGVSDYNIKFNTQRSELIKSNCWGCVYIENGSSIPSKFSAKATCFPAREGKPKYYRITNVTFEAAANVQLINFTSLRWKDGWGEQQDIIVGRGKLSEKDRKYWVLAHEMDHFRSYYDFWEFMVIKIFEATNTKYATEAECQDRIAEIRYNNLLNHLAARRRSNVFDDYPRGVPQRGSRYHDFQSKFRDDETFEWLPIAKISREKWFNFIIDKTPDRFLPPNTKSDEQINDLKPERHTKEYESTISSLKLEDKLLGRVLDIIKKNSTQTDKFSYLRAEWEDITKTQDAN